MPAPRKPVTVAIEDTFNFWRGETNIVIALWNYFLSDSGYFTADNPQLTNINVDGGTAQNVTIQDSTLEPSVSGFLTLNSVDLNDSAFEGGTVNNATITNSELANVTGSGYWNVDDATLNIANGTSSQRLQRGVGGNAELFWDRTNMELRIFDGSVPGGRIAAIDGLTRDAVIALIIALG